MQQITSFFRPSWRLVIAGMSLSCVCLSAQAEYIDSTTLKTLSNAYALGKTGSEAPVLHQAMLYSGYLAGVADAYHNVRFCLREGVEIDQIATLIRKHFEKNTGSETDFGHEVISEVLATEFPC